LLVGNPVGEAHSLEGLWGSARCIVQRAGSYVCPPGWTLRERAEPNHVLYLCVTGGADFRVGGRAYRLDPHTVVLTPPRVVQFTRGDVDPTEPLTLYVIQFAARLYGAVDISDIVGLPVTFTPAPDTMRALLDAAAGIVRELVALAPGHRLAVRALCTQMVALLWREVAETLPSEQSVEAVRLTTLARLAPALRVIQSRYAEHLGLEDLAEAVHLHPVYFATLFKEATGFTPMRFLTRFRLSRACELLLATNESVETIALATGFGDASHLSRVLRRAEGVSPGVYRQS
jgi:AraC-like DNA-binding protein